MRILGVRLAPDRNRRTRARRQLAMPGDEIGVEMGFEHPLDREPAVARLLEIHLDVARGVHDRRLAPVADQVRGVRETADVELLEVHRDLRAARSPGAVLPDPLAHYIYEGAWRRGGARHFERSSGAP